MKRILRIVLFIFLALLSGVLFAQVITTENFQNLTVRDGLVSEDVTDILILNDSSVWIATSAGLSHYNGLTFTNYTVTNSNLNNDNISELEYCQNSIWMITGSGIASFNGSFFTNYTTGNGLLSSSILGLAATSTDTLWLTSTSGTSKFDGNTFTNYPTQSGRDVETDNLDRVYVMRTSVANNFPFARLYENGSWSMPTQSGIDFGITSAKFIKTASNNLFVAGIQGSPTAFVKINYPLNCIKQSVYSNGMPHSSLNSAPIQPQQLEEFNGLRWMGAGQSTAFYQVSSDSNYTEQYISNSIAISSCIKAKADILAIGSDRGVYLTRPTRKENIDGLEFAVNSIRTSVSITDPLFYDFANTRPNFEFPKDSNSHGIFAANFIVAAKKATQSNFLVHPQQPYSESYTPGPSTNVGGLSKSYIVRVLKQDVDDHKTNFKQTGYSMSDGIRNWPARGDSLAGIAVDLAPFFDANNNGCYDPLNGDYPIINGDEAIYWINHPINQDLDLEYHWMMYAFNDSSLALDQTIFVDYTIVNRATTAYDSVKVGFYLDSDLGNAADDYVGCDSLNNIMYSYNGVLFDAGQGNSSSPYRNRTPALGVKFVSDPMVTLAYYNVGNSVNGDPSTTDDWLNYMNAKWKDGSNMKYGGDGYSSAGVTNTSTTHMFTGDPFTLAGWTELTPGAGVQSNPPGDRRVFGSIPYFSLQSGERKTIKIAVGVGRTLSSTTQLGQNIRELVGVLNGASNHLNSQAPQVLTFASTDTCAPVSVQELITDKNARLSIFPVPTSGELTIESDDRMELIEIYDMKGSKIKDLQVNQHRISVLLTEYQNGFYLIRVRTEKDQWLMKKIVKQE